MASDTLAYWVTAIAAAASAALALFALWVAWRSDRRTRRFQDAQWTLEHRWDPRPGKGNAAFAIRNRGANSAKNVRAICPWDPTGFLVPPKSWDLIPPDGDGVLTTNVGSSAWLGMVGQDPPRQVIEVSWLSLADEARSTLIALPKSHAPKGEQPLGYVDPSLEGNAYSP